jgi:hypothetical protein
VVSEKAARPTREIPKLWLIAIQIVIGVLFLAFALAKQPPLLAVGITVLMSLVLYASFHLVREYHSDPRLQGYLAVVAAIITLFTFTLTNPDGGSSSSTSKSRTGVLGIDVQSPESGTRSLERQELTPSHYEPAVPTSFVAEGDSADRRDTPASSSSQDTIRRAAMSPVASNVGSSRSRPQTDLPDSTHAERGDGRERMGRNPPERAPVGSPVIRRRLGTASPSAEPTLIMLSDAAYERLRALTRIAIGRAGGHSQAQNWVSARQQLDSVMAQLHAFREGDPRAAVLYEQLATCRTMVQRRIHWQGDQCM